MQKEREAEGDEFADKEKFVTSAYRKKMEEQALAEEEEARQARLEAVLDVTKQNDLSGFYRHIYRQVLDMYLYSTVLNRRRWKFLYLYWTALIRFRIRYEMEVRNVIFEFLSN